MNHKLIALLLLAAALMAACSPAAPTAAPTAKPFVFGMVFVGPKDDHGWSQAQYEAGLYLQQKIPGSQMVYLDKVNPSYRKGTTLEQVIDDLVKQGAQIVFTTSDDFKDDTHA